jgi:hypothetical protein
MQIQMRLVLFYLCAFFLLCFDASKDCHAQNKPPISVAQVIPYFTDSVETPYIFVKVKIGQNKTLLFLYDTGTHDDLVITPATLKMFPSAKKDGDYFALDKITITSESGDIEYKDIRSACADLTGLKGSRLENIAGIIGCRFLGNSVISINTQSKTITLGKRKANHLEDFTRINLESYPNDKRPYIRACYEL